MRRITAKTILLKLRINIQKKGRIRKKEIKGREKEEGCNRKGGKKEDNKSGEGGTIIYRAHSLRTHFRRLFPRMPIVRRWLPPIGID